MCPASVRRLLEICKGSSLVSELNFLLYAICGGNVHSCQAFSHQCKSHGLPERIPDMPDSASERELKWESKVDMQGLTSKMPEARQFRASICRLHAKKRRKRLS